MMTKVWLALSLTVGFSASVSAGELTSNCGTDYMGKFSCTSSFSLGGGSGDSAQGRKPSKEELRLIAEEEQARVDKWVTYCKPVTKIDYLGVSRFEYAHRGCDLGIVEEQVTSAAEAKR